MRTRIHWKWNGILIKWKFAYRLNGVAIGLQRSHSGQPNSIVMLCPTTMETNGGAKEIHFTLAYICKPRPMPLPHATRWLNNCIFAFHITRTARPSNKLHLIARCLHFTFLQYVLVWPSRRDTPPHVPTLTLDTFPRHVFPGNFIFFANGQPSVRVYCVHSVRTS